MVGVEAVVLGHKQESSLLRLQNLKTERAWVAEGQSRRCLSEWGLEIAFTMLW